MLQSFLSVIGYFSPFIKWDIRSRREQRKRELHSRNQNSVSFTLMCLFSVKPKFALLGMCLYTQRRCRAPSQAVTGLFASVGLVRLALVVGCTGNSFCIFALLVPVLHCTGWSISRSLCLARVTLLIQCCELSTNFTVYLCLVSLYATVGIKKKLTP